MQRGGLGVGSMVDENGKVRKTITLTTKQVGITGLTGLAVALAPYLKETFVTRVESQGQIERLNNLEEKLVSVEKTVVNSKSDLSEKIDSQTQQILDRMKDMQDLALRNSDRNERRIERLENEVAFSSRSKNHKGTN